MSTNTKTLYQNYIVEEFRIKKEPFYIPVSPHDANGPINIVAGAHVMMTIPNFYKLEYSTSLGTTYNKLITEPLDIENGFLHLSKKPGLGIELDIDYIEANPDPDCEWKYFGNSIWHRTFEWLQVLTTLDL